MTVTTATLLFMGFLSDLPQDALPVTLARDGRALLPVVAGSVAGATDALERTLERITGASFRRIPAGSRRVAGEAGIHVGLLADFPGHGLEAAPGLVGEEFLVRTDGKSLHLLGVTARGVRHAVSAFLDALGYRQFFPGEVWEEVPRIPVLHGSWSLRDRPSFETQREIWYGYGAYPDAREDLDRWKLQNRMGGPVEVRIGHTWQGLDPRADFERQPEWFALVDGERRPTKPCYSHPQVTARAIRYARERASRGDPMISASPPDGLGYCECDDCRSALGGGEVYREHGTLFARRPDGTVLNITSETLFAHVNKVAAAVSDTHPGALVGCYAYSAYSHPPSFDLHPAVFLQTTTQFRRTPLTLEEQLEVFGRKTRQLGVREYYSVYQWDWDYPDPGKLTPQRLQADLRFYRAHGVTGVNAEASNNWASRGLGYYLASRLLWDVDADLRSILCDFYRNAFGRAAPYMERYYVRWYGASAAMGEVGDLPERRVLQESGHHDVDLLRAAFRDLDDAARAVAGTNRHLRRVDHLRLYLHYLVLRWRVELAAASGVRERILAAIRDETIFGGRLASAHLIHARALIGKAFSRRFRRFLSILEGAPGASRAGAGWRVTGEPPDAGELERLWRDDRELLGIDRKDR